MLICFVTKLESKGSPRTFSPQTVTQMSKEKFLAPVDKRLIGRKVQAEQSKTEESEQSQDKKKQEVAKKPARKLLSEMTFDEVIVSKDRVMAGKNYTGALKYIERALRLSDDINETEKLLLEYADTLYACDRYEKASRSYNEFANLYPGSDKVEYALYQAVVCSSKLILDAERDQSKTHETIELADQFLQRADIFIEYKKKVEDIKQECMRTLAQSEFSVCNSFITRYEYAQAQYRLDGIRKDWLTQLPDLEPEILMLECTVAEKQNKIQLVEQKKKSYRTGFLKLLLNWHRISALIFYIGFCSSMIPTDRKIIGIDGETLVIRYLTDRGFIILARNYRKMYGEIDIIALKSDLIVFVEVKTRSYHYIEPTEIITLSKQKKISMTAHAFIASREYDDKTYRFDVAFVTLVGENSSIEYIENAFNH